MSVNVPSIASWIGAATGARLSIFIFHRVLPQSDPLLPDDPDAQWFERIVEFIARQYRVLPLADAIRLLAAGKLRSGAACVTFDDGYADNLDQAAPILARHGLSATFFIATSFIGGGGMFNDTVIEAVRRAPAGRLDWRDLKLGTWDLDNAESRVHAYRQILIALKHLPPGQRAELTAEIAIRAGLPDRDELMMTVEQLRALAEMGMEIGAHTRGHPILARLDDRAAEQEIAGGIEDLRHWLGRRPTLFAYPNGVPSRDYTARDVGLVRKLGFEAAVSTSPGACRVGSDMYQLPRFTPWDRTLGRWALRAWRNLAAPSPLGV